MKRAADKLAAFVAARGRAAEDGAQPAVHETQEVALAPRLGARADSEGADAGGRAPGRA